MRIDHRYFVHKYQLIFTRGGVLHIALKVKLDRLSFKIGSIPEFDPFFYPEQNKVYDFNRRKLLCAI
jgi:hypothetical protein